MSPRRWTTSTTCSPGSVPPATSACPRRPPLGQPAEVERVARRLLQVGVPAEPCGDNLEVTLRLGEGLGRLWAAGGGDPALAATFRHHATGVPKRCFTGAEVSQWGDVFFREVPPIRFVPTGRQRIEPEAGGISGGWTVGIAAEPLVWQTVAVTWTMDTTHDGSASILVEEPFEAVLTVDLAQRTFHAFMEVCAPGHGCATAFDVTVADGAGLLGTRRSSAHGGRIPAAETGGDARMRKDTPQRILPEGGGGAEGGGGRAEARAVAP